MIPISKAEAEAIRRTYPNVHVSMTSKQTNHKKYFAPEEPRVLKLLDKMRNPKMERAHDR